MLAIKSMMMRSAVLIVLASLTLSAQQPAPASRVPPASLASPASVGIAADRLDRLHAAMKGFVDRKEVSGIVTLVAREGKTVDLHAVGLADVENNVPMRTDAIFRIASMTKPVTSVAIMMLFEENKLFLTDPVTKFIPAFKGVQVLEDGKSVPARRAITVRDLLTHKSGITYGFLNGGVVGSSYRKNGVIDGLTTTTMTLEENINRLGAEPLVAQPGSAFNYSLSTDVLGRIVEVASGQPLNVFFKERIFKPLKMNDTDFSVPESKWPRFVTVYSPDGKGGIRPMTDPESFGNAHFSPWAYYKEGKTYFSGGAGLTSTASDYARFATMLLNGGGLEGARLLSPKTIEMMTLSHTSELTPPLPLLGPGVNFGLGFRVVTELASTQTLGSNGLYGWSGIYGTNFWVDPSEKLVAVVMVQKYPGAAVAGTFQPMVYQALVR
ncbi:MAG TPA: serine hydrolase domain-containing protein [Vicinamibacterales bacterium]|nr:serine hydrolase domain-containing protein [Vicinamibacterales bacterium]